MRPYRPYVPQTIGEIWDMLASFTGGAPKFLDESGYFPGQSIETEFYRLKEGLRLVRKKLGEERYLKLDDMADRMRALFEADPEEKTGESKAGRQLIFEMEDVLNEVRRRRRPANASEAEEDDQSDGAARQ